MHKDGVVTSEQEREDLPASPSAGQRGRFRATQPPALAPKKDRAKTGVSAGGDGASQSSTEVNPTSASGHGDVAMVGDQASGAHNAAAVGDSNPAAGSTVSATTERETSLRTATSGGDHSNDHSNDNSGNYGGNESGEQGSGHSNGQASDQNDKQSDEQIVRAGGSMAIATLISRITGFLRTVFIASALGGAVASAFNTANTLPNLVTELVLGAVLTSLVVPVLVRAEKEDADRGEAFIRRLLTLTFSLTVVITLVSVACAPLLVRMSLDSEGHVNVGMSTAFAYLVLPQIMFYAMFAVFMAILNTKGVFKPGAWAPVVNNVVTLAVLGLYMFLPRDTKLQPMDNVTITDPHVLLLGLGTTAGVVMQALIMVPFLRKAGINLRPLWGIDERLKSFGGMAIAIVVYVAISQVGWLLNNRIASDTWEVAPTIYMQAWQLLQMPYGVIGVTLLTAVMPRLSRNAAEGDDKAVVRDLTVASKLTMLAMVPIIVFFTCFGTLVSAALFAYKEFSLDDANVLGWTISFSAFTLIPYALVLLHLRVFYAREEVWTPTFIIAGITVTKLAFAYIAPQIATEPRLVVVLLGAANGLGFMAGAIIGDRLLRRSLGDLQFRKVTMTVLWALGSSLVGALIAWRVDVVLARYAFQTLANPWFVVRLFIAGVLFLGVTGLILVRAPLPEIQTLVGALSRIPGLSRVLPSRRPLPSDEQSTVEAGPRRLSPQELAAREAIALDHMMAGVALPPLAAGRVRGPRLVPGAPLLEGRYRLLADHGGWSAARFWQGRELATGDIVGLTIMDPVAFARSQVEPGVSVPVNGPAVAHAKDEMLRRSAKLKQFDAPGMAQVNRVIDYGNLVVIVSSWVQGSPLTKVAESQPEPLAAAFAVASLADAAAQAEASGTALGLDHRDRVRIGTDGAAVLAFPGVLPHDDTAQDAHGVAVALRLLLEHVPYEQVPEELTRIYKKIHEFDGEKVEPEDLHKAAKSLRDLKSGQLAIQEDQTPDPSARSGFGAEGNRPVGMAAAAAIAFISVVIIAALVAAVVSVVGGDRKDSPLSTDSLRQGAQAVRGVDPADVPLSKPLEWLPADVDWPLDRPDLARLITDGDPETFWQSNPATVQLGGEPGTTKPGIGLLMTLPEGTALSQVQLRGLTRGTTMELRLATADSNGKLASLDQTQLLKTVKADSADMTVNLAGTGSASDSNWGAGNTSRGADGADGNDTGASAAAGEGDGNENENEESNREKGKYDTDKVSAAKGNRLLIWITGLPLPKPATISEVSAAGNWLDQATSDEDSSATQPTQPSEQRQPAQPKPSAQPAQPAQSRQPAQSIQPVG